MTGTEHYTPQYILDAVIACMGAIDLDPASNSHEIPNVPERGTTPLKTTGLCSPGWGGSFSIPRSGPVSSSGSRSYTRSGPQAGPSEAIVLWKSATETSLHGRR